MWTEQVEELEEMFEEESPSLGSARSLGKSGRFAYGGPVSSSEHRIFRGEERGAFLSVDEVSVDLSQEALQEESAQALDELFEAVDRFLPRSMAHQRMEEVDPEELGRRPTLLVEGREGAGGEEFSFRPPGVPVMPV